MSTIDGLKEALDKGYEVYIASSVFKELTTDTPSVTLWTLDEVLNITSTEEYNTVHYYKKEEMSKICDVSDPDTIIDIYNATAGYVPKNIAINSLIGIFSRKNTIK